MAEELEAVEELSVLQLRAQLKALCLKPRSQLKGALRQQLAEALRSHAAGQLEPTAPRAMLRARLEEWKLQPQGRSAKALQEQVAEVFRSIPPGELDLPTPSAKAVKDPTVRQLWAQLHELCQHVQSRSKATVQDQLAEARKAQDEGRLEATCRKPILLQRLTAWGLEPMGKSKAVLKKQVEHIFRHIAYHKAQGGDYLEDIKKTKAATPLETKTAAPRSSAAATAAARASASAPAPAPAPAPASPAHVLVVLSGLQGSGKSTLSKLLGSIFGGTLWLNQDEITEARAAQSFREGVRAALEAAAAGQSPRLVLVDKMNHRQEHRRFLFQQVEETRWRERGGRLLLVQLLPDQGSWDLDRLHERIEARGDAHRTLRPSSELRAILERTAQDAEPISKEELDRFDDSLELPDSYPIAKKAMSVAGALYKLGWGNALEWRNRLLGMPVAGSTELQGLPPWVQVLPLNPKASEAPDAQKADWDALVAFFAMEFQRLQKEEEDWRNKGD